MLGVTLVEVVVTLGVLGILSAVAAPSLLDLFDRRRVIALANEVTNIIDYTRSQTATGDTQLYAQFSPGVVASMTCAVVGTWAPQRFECPCNDSTPVGGICGGGGGTNMILRKLQLPTSTGVAIAVSATRWGSSQPNEIFFPRPQMTAPPLLQDFQVAVTSRRGNSLNIRVNALGRVHTCSPDGRISGYELCSVGTW
jgi:type II secretory pathway pseudopilin PulG